MSQYKKAMYSKEELILKEENRKVEVETIFSTTNFIELTY